jgi:hypothetical protein
MILKWFSGSSNNFGKTRGLFKRYSLLDEEEGGEKHFVRH